MSPKWEVDIEERVGAKMTNCNVYDYRGPPLQAPPKVITYRDYKNYILDDFRKELRGKVRETPDLNYNLFEKTFLDVLERHAPTKKKTVRQNNKPY